ncbi:MAG: RsmB/NOP family class I SAM-dependent RNA methyltransferase [bacterium]|nr:RsmB/NOP family class I SAM-dependent RNA methyltransferase [bacterium]
MEKTKENNPEGKLPEKFLERLRLQFPDHFRQIRSTFVRRPPAIRVNTLLTPSADLRKRLETQGIKLKSYPALANAFIVVNTDRKAITATSEYEQGLIYIQSIASQLIVRALDPQPGERVLDMCAAPGSKTSQMAILMKTEGELVANDQKEKRIYRLRNVLRHQRVDDFVTVKNYPGQNYPKHFPAYFDRVLVDTTCSSEATFIEGERKSLQYWSHHKVKNSARIQRKLLVCGWECLKPGGTLVYSTCTLSPEENEVLLSKFLAKHPEAQVQPLRWKGIKTLPIADEWQGKPLDPQVQFALRLMPTKEVEGFFMARIRKELR